MSIDLFNKVLTGFTIDDLPLLHDNHYIVHEETGPILTIYRVDKPFIYNDQQFIVGEFILVERVDQR